MPAAALESGSRDGEDEIERMNARWTSIAAPLLLACACVLPVAFLGWSSSSAGSDVVSGTRVGATLAAKGDFEAPRTPARFLATQEGSAVQGLRSTSGEDGAPDPAGFLRELIAAGEEEPEFLHPDLAFRVAGSLPEPGVAVVRWDIEPGYYLYAKRMEVRIPDGVPPGTTIVGVDLPQGEVQEDPYFGKVRIYRSDVAATVRLAHAGAPPSALALDVVYQGCADEGLCYPPIRKAVDVRPGGDPAATSGSGALLAGSSGTAETGAPLSETDRIAWQLAAGSLGASLAAFFGFGLLLSFTPCIFPMIPILSSILVADERRGRTRARGFTLSFAYVAGSALAWAGIGWVAGLLGANIQIALQSPWALVAVSAAFVLLALSMFGFFTLELPAGWTTRATGWTNRAGSVGGYAGAAAMGVVSALVVGPCVAAPMAGAVLYIGQAGDAVRGSLALFSMGFGMGVPLLVLGASSQRLLPRVGPWMDSVQRAAGVVLLGVAAYLLERVLPASAALVGWALVAVAAALVLLRAAWRRPARASRHVATAGGLVAAACAVVLVIGATTGAHDPLDPFRGLRAAPADGVAGQGRLEFIAIKGLDGPEGLDAALARAEAAGRFVMLDFYADWCVSCKEMEDITFRDPRVLAALEDVRILRADVTANDSADRALMRRVGIFGPPAILFFGPDRLERRRYRTVGFKNATDFTKRVTGATSAA